MLLALLLVTRAAAEWVEISQQHYHYTNKPTRLTTQRPSNTHLKDALRPYQDKDPTRNIYPNQHNSQTPTRKAYQDQTSDDPERNTYHYHGSSIKDNFPDDLLHNPKTNNFDQDVKPVRINPILQDNSDDATRNTYIYQDSSQNRNAYKSGFQKPMSDDYFNKDVEFQNTRKTYLNESIEEHNWNQKKHPQNNVRGNDNTQRQIERNDKPDQIIIRKYDNSVPDTGRIKDETVSGSIERVPNKGSVKRVQLENSPVKSPALKQNIPESIPNRRKDEHRTQNYDNFSDDFDIVTDNFNSHEAGVSMKPLNIFEHTVSSSEEVLSTKNDFTKGTTSSVNRHAFKVKPDSNNNEATHSKINSRNKLNEDLDVMETTVKKGVTNRPKPNFDLNSNEDLPDLVNKNKQTIENKEVNRVNNGKDQIKTNHNPNEKKETSSEGEQDTAGEIKVNTIDNILKFMKIVAETIAKNTRRGANGKISYLNDLKHTLLNNIKDRIDATWPDDSKSGRRHSRAASPRGHVEFPSSESSLMTISFLTFAVFLIKLVLQVIQAYKHKTMVMAPLMVATAGRTVTQKLRNI